MSKDDTLRSHIVFFVLFFNSTKNEFDMIWTMSNKQREEPGGSTGPFNDT